MSKLSLFDKIGVLLETTASSNLHIFACLLFIVLGLALSTTNKNNEKKNKIFYISYIIFILIFILVSHASSLGKMFSYMMNNFFIVVYFPNLAIYLAAIIITNIILFISVFSFKTTKKIKNLNIVVFTIMNYLLLLILNVINKNNLDIFSKESIYENKECLALIELSSTIFIIWILFLVVYRIILIYLRKEYRPKVKKVIIRKKVKKLPENYEPLDFPSYIYGNIPTNKTIIKQDSTLLKEFESKFTLEDYKLFSKILKEQKQSNNSLKEELSKINIVEEDKDFKEDFRNNQKQEIMKMEEERRELLRLAKEKQIEENKQEENIPIETYNFIPEEEYIKPIDDIKEVEIETDVEEEVYIEPKKDIIIQDEDNYEIEDREQAKLTELERLYQSIK